MAETIEICFELIHETDEAILVSDGDDEVWLPKSELDEPAETWSFWINESIDLEVSVWLAQEKGLI